MSVIWTTTLTINIKQAINQLSSNNASKKGMLWLMDMYFSPRNPLLQITNMLTLTLIFNLNKLSYIPTYQFVNELPIELPTYNYILELCRPLYSHAWLTNQSSIPLNINQNLNLNSNSSMFKTEWKEGTYWPVNDLIKSSSTSHNPLFVCLFACLFVYKQLYPLEVSKQTSRPRKSATGNKSKANRRSTTRSRSPTGQWILSLFRSLFVCLLP